MNILKRPNVFNQIRNITYGSEARSKGLEYLSLENKQKHKFIPAKRGIWQEPKDFLASIGRNAVEFSEKFTSWEHLFRSNSTDMKALGIPIKTRKWILNNMDWFQKGKDPEPIPIPKRRKQHLKVAFEKRQKTLKKREEKYWKKHFASAPLNCWFPKREQALSVTKRAKWMHDESKLQLTDGVESKRVFDMNISPSLTSSRLASPSVSANSNISIHEELNQFAMAFEGKEVEWDQKEKSLKRLSILIKNNNHPKEVISFFKLHFDKIISCLHSLRTALCLTACQTIQDFTETLKKKTDPFAEFFIVNLLKIISTSKKITCQMGLKTLQSVFFQTSLSSKNFLLIFNALSDKSTYTRQNCFSLLLSIAVTARDKAIKSSLQNNGLDILENCIRKGFSDASGPVRETARFTFKEFQEIWPERAENSFLDSLPLSTKKTISKELLEVPKLRSNSSPIISSTYSPTSPPLLKQKQSINNIDTTPIRTVQKRHSLSLIKSKMSNAKGEKEIILEQIASSKLEKHLHAFKELKGYLECKFSDSETEFAQKLKIFLLSFFKNEEKVKNLFTELNESKEQESKFIDLLETCLLKNILNLKELCEIGLDLQNYTFYKQHKINENLFLNIFFKKTTKKKLFENLIENLVELKINKTTSLTVIELREKEFRAQQLIFKLMKMNLRDNEINEGENSICENSSEFYNIEEDLIRKLLIRLVPLILKYANLAQKKKSYFNFFEDLKFVFFYLKQVKYELLTRVFATFESLEKEQFFFENFFKDMKSKVQEEVETLTAENLNSIDDHFTDSAYTNSMDFIENSSTRNVFDETLPDGFADISSTQNIQNCANNELLPIERGALPSESVIAKFSTPSKDFVNLIPRNNYYSKVDADSVPEDTNFHNIKLNDNSDINSTIYQKDSGTAIRLKNLTERYLNYFEKLNSGVKVDLMLVAKFLRISNETKIEKDSKEFFFWKQNFEKLLCKFFLILKIEDGDKEEQGNILLIMNSLLLNQTPLFNGYEKELLEILFDCITDENISVSSESERNLDTILKKFKKKTLVLIMLEILENELKTSKLNGTRVFSKNISRPSLFQPSNLSAKFKFLSKTLNLIKNFEQFKSFCCLDKLISICEKEINSPNLDNRRGTIFVLVAIHKMILKSSKNENLFWNDVILSKLTKNQEKLLGVYINRSLKEDMENENYVESHSNDTDNGNAETKFFSIYENMNEENNDSVSSYNNKIINDVCDTAISA
ncbi:suppressor of tub2 mutation [Lobulomyces angularis]|nr:suppressor of tub2 mutation [Lobulomyces angularis]